MTFASSLVSRLSDRHLLKHPFYQKWSDGSLSLETLQLYARQYFHHVAAFPRYLSATHSNCADLSARQLLLENLIDEERGEENHPELWLRFAEALGESRQAVHQESLLPETRSLIDTLMSASRESFEAGLGALFAYEHQIPEVATFKIDALKAHYGVADERGLGFFEVHRKADVYHSQAISEIFERLPEASRERVRESAERTSQALWNFLSGVEAASQRAA